MSDSEEEAQFDDEDDMPLSSLKKESSGGSRESPKRKRKEVNYADDGDDDEDEEFDDEEEEGDDGDDDDDSDDDDIPLAALKKSPSKSSSSSKKAAKPKAKAAPKKKAKTASKTPSKPAPATVAKSSDYLTPSAALYDSGCKKGMLIQKLLCRWWYATTWPDPSKIPEKPPKHYDKLDGFEGVFICTSGGKVGHIMDVRDKENCPCFANYAKKPSSELKELLLKALEEQKKQLIKVEGEGTITEKEIDEDIKWVTKKVKPEEADKEAAKVLKAAKMKL